MAPVLAVEFLTHGQADIIAWGGLAAATTFLVLTALLILCSSCDREKKPKQNGDHENLMTVPSDKETFSHSITSLGTDPPANSYQNGGISNGDVISEDSTTACIQPYEDVQTSYPDLCDQQDYIGKSLRCPQSRELPRIPPNSNLETAISARPVENYPGLGTEGPYEVLKDSASQDNIIEDSLYETVKEIKEVSVACSTDGNKKKTASRATVQHACDQSPESRTEAAEYASVNRNRKSQQRASAECALNSPREQEDEAPPPVPEKLLDENENVQRKEAEEEQEENDTEGASQRQSLHSYKSREEDPCLTEDEIAAMYSTVSKSGHPVKSPSIPSHPTHSQDVTTSRSPSICSDLYATVRDHEKSPNAVDVPQPTERTNGESDPEYEVIPPVCREEERTAPVPNANRPALMLVENDYESIGDLQQNRDITRL